MEKKRLLMPKSDQGYTRKAYIISLIKRDAETNIQIFFWNKTRPKPTNEKCIVDVLMEEGLVEKYRIHNQQ